jgi:hypothetical protein
MKNWLVLISLCVILITFYSQFSKDEVKGKTNEKKLQFLYSHPFEERSYLNSTTDGKTFKKKNLNSGDLFLISENKVNNNLEFLPTYKSEIFTLKENGNMVSQKVIAPLTFMINNKDIHIQSFNKDVKINILQVEDKKFHLQYKLELPTYLLFADYDAKYIYIYNDVMEELKHNLYIIDRKNGNLIKKIRLKGKAKDIYIKGSYIYLSTNNNLTILERDSWKIKVRDYPFENVEGNKLHNINDKIYIVLVDKIGKLYMGELDKSLNWTNKAKLETTYLALVFQDNELFILNRVETDKIGGVVSVYNLKDMKQVKQFAIPKEDLKVVNFYVSKNGRD